MSPVSAILDLRLKPEMLDQAPAILRDVLKDTRAFPGCVSIDTLIDAADPAHVVVYEVWDSAEADAAYRAWRATPAGASSLGSVLAGAPSLTKFTRAADI
ncbi:MAG: antibiotic biosynthesis monooxygenase [Frankiaceae bacterium]|jgi:quinol monooxygenase YgiN|nr:antibiotic biosynthesis monooxygenase [Frankiaceae bacterium]